MRIVNKYQIVKYFIAAGIIDLFTGYYAAIFKMG